MHRRDSVHLVKKSRGDYIHVAKNMEGIMSTYTKMGRRDFVREGYCPYTIRKISMFFDRKNTHILSGDICTTPVHKVSVVSKGSDKTVQVCRMILLCIAPLYLKKPFV